MKLILDHGSIDYAVAAKRGDLPDLDSSYRFGTASAYVSAWRRGSPAISTFLIFGQVLLERGAIL